MTKKFNPLRKTTVSVIHSLKKKVLLIVGMTWYRYYTYFWLGNTFTTIFFDFFRLFFDFFSIFFRFFSIFFDFFRFVFRFFSIVFRFFFDIFSIFFSIVFRFFFDCFSIFFSIFFREKKSKRIEKNRKKVGVPIPRHALY